MMQQIHIQRLQRELNPNFLFDLQKKPDSDKIFCCYWVSKGLDSYKWSQKALEEGTLPFLGQNVISWGSRTIYHP